MRKVVLYTLMALDGAVEHPEQYFALERGEVPVFDSVMDDFEREVIGSQDAVLLGRGMYDEWARFWPTASHEPFASFINDVQKYVVTSRPLTLDWGPSQALTGPVETTVRELTSRPGGDIGVHGSIELARSLLRAGLVDELRLVVAPSTGYEGRRLFEPGDDRRHLQLTSSRSTPSGALLLSYRSR